MEKVVRIITIQFLSIIYIEFNLKWEVVYSISRFYSLSRVNTLDHLSSSQYLKKERIQTKYFNLFTCKDKTANIYIEGDGLSWITSHTPSNNPTPINPVALKLALQDKNPCIIYIARPCQYINNYKCKTIIWTNKRFSTKIIKSYNEALNNIKKKYKISSYTLFGYSGGGAIATILAAKRDKVQKRT